MSFFGTNLKKIRKLKSLSQQELADIIDLKRGTLGAYEEGRSEPKIDTLIRIANYFSISIDGLLQRELTVNELLKYNTQLIADERKLRKTFPRVPIITKKNQEDYVRYYQKESFIENMPYVEWPLAADGNQPYRAYVVQDLEMSHQMNGFFPEDIILLEMVNIQDITPNRLVLVLYSDLKLRRFSKVEDKIVLKAAHPAIEDISLQVTDVKEIWVAIGFYQKYRNFTTIEDPAS